MFQDKRSKIIVSIILVSLSVFARAATTVVVQTNILDEQNRIQTFSLELYEDVAPTAVARFLDNVEQGRYQFTMIHHALGAGLRGGLFRYNSCFTGPERINPTASVTAVDNGLENNTGTIALIRDRQDPSLLTDEWQINLASNPQFPDQDNPPVVIGEVVEGLDLLLGIDEFAWRVPMQLVSIAVPTQNYPQFYFVDCSLFTQQNTILLSMGVESVDPFAPVNYYEVASNQIFIKVDAGSAGLLSLALQIESTAPQGVVGVLTETVTELAREVPGMAKFDANSGELFIPQLYVGSELAYQNVLFTLSNVDELQFTLLSYELP